MRTKTQRKKTKTSSMSTQWSNSRQFLNRLCSPKKWKFKIAHVKFTLENTADTKLPRIITLDEQYTSIIVFDESKEFNNLIARSRNAWLVLAKPDRDRNVTLDYLSLLCCKRNT